MEGGVEGEKRGEGKNRASHFMRAIFGSPIGGLCGP